MMDSKTFQKEVIRMWDTVRNNLYKGDVNCNGVNCNQCPIHGTKHGCSSPLSIIEIYEKIERWSKDHPQKKYKVSKIEYDILRTAIDYGSDEVFYDSYMLSELFEKGYFNGATGETYIRDYFENCEVEKNE